MHPPRILVLAMTLAALLSGCTPAPAPTPSALPTVPSCTPEFGGDPYPCTQLDHEANQKMLARYAEAERVYREFDRLSEKELLARTPAPSEELLDLVSPGERDRLQDVRRAELEAQFSGSARIDSVERRKPASGGGARLVLAFCVDRSQWQVTYADGGTDPTTPVYHVVGFDEHPKVTIRSLEMEEGPACAP